jgi:Mrp family chromosome partitioning ATPase
MTFAQYWAILMKQWKLIVICFVLVGVGSYTVSKLLTPLYQSSVLIDVVVHSTNNQSDYNNLLASDQLVQTVAQLATSDPVLREVASHYPGLSLDDFSKKVTSTARPNTQLLEIDVLDPSPTRAALYANDVAATLIKQQIQFTQQDNIRGQQQLQQDINTTRAQIEKLTNNIANLQAQSGTRGKVAALQVELNGLQLHNNQGQTALAQLELIQAQNQDIFHIVQPAQPATKVHQPNVLLNTGIGSLAGLILGVLLALAYAQLDTRIRTEEALSQLTSRPVLGTIWRIRSKKEDVLNPTGQNANNESYRILRTNVGFASIDKPLHSLLITSALPKEGKSTTAANLAIFMAKTGRRTLLVDADLHRPSQHTFFDLPPYTMGLSNAILACGVSSGVTSTPDTPTQKLPSVPNMTSVLLDPFIHTVGIPHLWVMPSGPLPPNPSELLDSKSMQRLLAMIANSKIELVIFDSAPLLGLSDASILAPKVDGTLVVVDVTRAKKRNLAQLQSILAQTGTRFLGCVVNKQRLSRSDYSYYYYYHTEIRQNVGNQSSKNGRHSSAPPDTTVTPVLAEQTEKNVRSI